MTKSKRVQYNFLLNIPQGEFTMGALMAANPGVSYITLYMRLKKALGKTIKKVGKVQVNKRGRSQLSYVTVPKRSHKKKIAPVAQEQGASGFVTQAQIDQAVKV